jgi:hypothetical protein
MGLPFIRKGRCKVYDRVDLDEHMQQDKCRGRGRVEMWRGDRRFGLSVAAPFVWRCPSNLALTPFPHPAHRTGLADRPHPALGQNITPSPMTGCGRAPLGVRG